MHGILAIGLTWMVGVVGVPFCPFRHGPGVGLPGSCPQTIKSGASPSGDRPGVSNAGLSHAERLGGDCVRIHDGGAPSFRLTQACSASVEASVATALRLDHQRRERARPLQPEDVELCADEYVYDEDALRQALTSASQLLSSSSTPAVAEFSGEALGSRIKSED